MKCTPLPAIGILLAILSPVTAAESEANRPLAILTAGQRFPASLAGVDQQWQLLMRSAQGDRRLAAADLVSWGTPAEAMREPQLFATETGIQVELVFSDGGLLVCRLLKSDQERVEVHSSLFGDMGVSLDQLSGILFHPPIDFQRRDILRQSLFSTANEEHSRDVDRVILENGDEVAGTVIGLDGTTLQLQTKAGMARIEVPKIAALAFNPSLSNAGRSKGLRGIAGFRDGSRLLARSLVLDAQQVKLTRADSSLWTAPSSALVILQPLGGKADYLSDLQAESYRHVPYLSLGWPWHADRNVSGSQLRCGGRMYVKGIGMHSAARLTFRLDDGGKTYRRFDAEIGIDDQTSGRGSVMFRVFVDTQQRYVSPVIRGGQAPQTISVDVAGGKQLSLIVDFAERGDEQDFADWLNARLVE